MGVLVFLLVTLPLIATMGINNKGKRGDCNICLTWMFAVMWFIAVIVTYVSPRLSYPSSISTI